MKSPGDLVSSRAFFVRRFNKMQVTAQLVKELREKTGAGMMDCKKALVSTEGDMDKAIQILREKGLADAAKKSGRIAAEGVVDAYIHMGGRIGVLIEVNCETDFVAKTDDFKEFVKNMAMQVAASNPLYVSRDEVPTDLLDKEREIYRNAALNEGKPEKIVERIVEGRVEKYYKEVCLLEQPFIKDPDVSVEQVQKALVAKLGENIAVRRFVRWERGEGLEKRECDLAAEVQAQIEGK
ncbi:MAG: translation elongation factor Ts [Limnochordia bacterium]|jgi:elongation factor Ts|nr:translation elongation factor Ts [Limnochordia bacterium]MDD2756130.1 translation elongation factor Ts [Methanothrix sp.]MDD4516917.1 translation elongation factor Ts [Limnochordia bacterium]